jgi:hypothetical protein
MLTFFGAPLGALHLLNSSLLLLLFHFRISIPLPIFYNTASSKRSATILQPLCSLIPSFCSFFFLLRRFGSSYDLLRNISATSTLGRAISQALLCNPSEPHSRSLARLCCSCRCIFAPSLALFMNDSVSPIDSIHIAPLFPLSPSCSISLDLSLPVCLSAFALSSSSLLCLSSISFDSASTTGSVSQAPLFLKASLTRTLILCVCSSTLALSSSSLLRFFLNHLRFHLVL